MAAVREERPITLSWNGRSPLSTPSAESGEGNAPARYTNEDRTGRFFFGDNVAGLDALRRTEPESVTLAYMDPPFHTNRVHELVENGDHSAPKSERTRKTAFDDRWDDRASYLMSLGDRIVRLRDLLAPHGSLVVHVDPKTSHYVKVMCDEIFGEECFASEIVWRYRRWPSKTPNFQRVHDVLLRYRKDAKVKPRWNQSYEPLAASTRAVWGETKQRAVFKENGHRQKSSVTSEPSLGVPMGDVWEIGVLAPMARERTGYPSQKPLALLDRLVTALSDEGDLVLDPYAGSGTTLVSAAKLGRRFVGLDASTLSLETSLSRLADAGVTMRHDEGAEPMAPPASEPRLRADAGTDSGLAKTGVSSAPRAEKSARKKTA